MEGCAQSWSGNTLFSRVREPETCRAGQVADGDCEMLTSNEEHTTDNCVRSTAFSHLGQDDTGHTHIQFPIEMNAEERGKPIFLPCEAHRTYKLTTEGTENRVSSFQHAETCDAELPADSTYLYLMARLLGNSLPDLLFLRTRSARLRWNDQGRITELTPLEAGIDQRLLAIVSTDDRLHKALFHLGERSSDGQSWALSKRSHSLAPCDAFREQELFIEAVKWVCFAFPRVESKETRYNSSVRLFLPLLKSIWHKLESSQLPEQTKHEFAEVLLVASSISDTRNTALPMAMAILDEESPLNLRAGVALEQSISFRLHGDYDKSERTIHDFCCRCTSPSDQCLPAIFKAVSPGMHVRSRAIYGLLHRSHLENLIQCDQYDLAELQINDWPLPDSQIEWETFPSQTLTSCKIYRSRGTFEVAKTTLEMCLDAVRKHNANSPIYPRVLCQLMDVFSDLQQPHQSDKLIATASEKYTDGAMRRIRVSSVDADLLQNRYENATKTIHELRKVFEKQKPLNVSDELLHIRLLVAAARISHLQDKFLEALHGWESVLDHAQRYMSFRGEGFTYAVVHMSMSLAYLQLNDQHGAVQSFTEGKRILGQTKRDYWIPTLPTWLDYISSRICSTIGWRCEAMEFDSRVSSHCV
jgi:hypothetical protein